MKRLISFVVVFIMLLLETSFADWKFDEKGRWYERYDGSYPINCVENISGKPYGFDEEGYMSWCIEDIGGVSFKLTYEKGIDGKRELSKMELYDANQGNYDNTTGAADMSKYDQLRVTEYDSVRVTVNGLNAKGETIIKVFSVKVPKLSGYNADNINRIINRDIGTIVKNYLELNYDFSNEKKRDKNDNSASVLNDGVNITLGNGYFTMKLKTWGSINIVLKYDLATDELTLMQ